MREKISAKNVDSIPISWRETGKDGELLLFLHGLGGSRFAWEPQLKAFSDSFHCVAWDMPGYGNSQSLENLTFNSLVSSITRLLDTLEVEKAHLIGLSFGGMHALHTAILAPERVSSLVITDSSPSFGLDGTNPEIWVEQRLEQIKLGKEPKDFAEQVLRSISGPNFEGKELENAIYAFSRINPEAFEASCRCLTTHDVINELPSINSPTLVIVGELDQETPPSYSHLLAEKIPNAHFLQVEGSGHLTPSDKPNEFNSAVASFLLSLQ